MGLNIFPAGGWFKSLVKELRFCKHVAQQKKKKKKKGKNKKNALKKSKEVSFM